MRSEDRPERAVLFVLQETLFPVRQKRSARIALRRNGRRCSGSPPQAENPAKQDSIFTAFHKMQHTSSPILPYPKRKRMRMP